MSEKDGGNTVFINKLYDLLENKDLDDLIWWAANGESFLIRPSESFSQNLAHYFKHTNITSFVRQLNIYGFHKISNDHFHNLKREKNKNRQQIIIQALATIMAGMKTSKFGNLNIVAGFSRKEIWKI